MKFRKHGRNIMGTKQDSPVWLVTVTSNDIDGPVDTYNGDDSAVYTMLSRTILSQSTTGVMVYHHGQEYERIIIEHAVILEGQLSPEKRLSHPLTAWVKRTKSQDDIDKWVALIEQPILYNYAPTREEAIEGLKL